MKYVTSCGVLLGIGVLLVGCITGCSGARSAAQEPMQSPLATVERAALAIDMGWGHPNATPLPYQGIGLGVPQQIHLAMEAIPPIASLFPVGLNGDTLIAAAIFAKESDAISEEVHPPRGGMVTVDMRTGRIRVLSDGFSTQARTDGRYVVWNEEVIGSGLLELHVYDLEQDRELVWSDRSRRQVDVSDGVVVWQEYRDGGWGIYGLNLEDGQEFAVANWSAHLAVPYISGEWVIYLELGSQVADLHAHNISTGEHLALGQVTSPEVPGVGWLQHAIESGYVVVWVDQKTHQIHIYDLNNRQERVLELPAHYQPYQVTLSGDVLLMLLAGGEQVGYDLRRDVLFNVPIVPPGDWDGFTINGIAISGDCLTWVIDLGGGQRVYTASILRLDR